MRILFLCAHPDDSEFTSGNTEVMAAKQGHEVFIACMTSDEYGTTRNAFKGKRIKQIRIREMERAARIIGAKLDWLGFIDGYLPFNKKALSILKNYIEKVNPGIIFAPDPIFTLDFHPDHVNTGKLIYIILKQMKPPPILLFFHTLKPNYFVPCLERKKARDAFACHVSQGFSRKGAQSAQTIMQLVYGIHIPNHFFAEGFRLILFKPTDNILSRIRKILYWISRAISTISLLGKDHYLPGPKELGLL
jgi:LmbE family N-acetylglucosaminyl deacetylase